jgi:hypothetical protein
MFLSVGFFAIFWVFGNVDYATVFSVAPFINESAITIVGLLLLIGAMRKSAQIGLHTWLPDAMEGRYYKIIVMSGMIILVYLSYFESYTRIIIHRSIFPTFLDKKQLNIITGNMLGDGSINYPNRTRDTKRGKKGLSTGNPQYKITIDAYSYDYIMFLYKEVYSQFSYKNPYPYPNINLPQHNDKKVRQYHFGTRCLPLFKELHNIWYRYDKDLNKYIKIVPYNIRDMFSPLSLAIWLIDDRYFSENTIYFCTESFTKKEVILLQTLLTSYSIKTGLSLRNKMKDNYRIRVSSLSIPLLRELVRPYMHPDFLYKLGE